MTTTNWYHTLVALEHAKTHRTTSHVSITRETSRQAGVSFDMEGTKRYYTLSKRNKREASALRMVQQYIAGEI